MTGTDVNFQFQGEPGIEFRVWNGFDIFGPGTDSPVDMSLWQTAEALGGQEFRGPGEVVAAGWTRSFAPPVEVDGKGAGGGGRSLVLGRNRVGVPAESATSTSGGRSCGHPTSRAGQDESFVVRFVTRDADSGGRTPDAARLHLRAPMPQMEVWQDGAGGRWRRSSTTSGNEGSAAFQLPAGAVQGDQVFLRFPAFSSIVDVNGLFTLRESA